MADLRVQAIIPRDTTLPEDVVVNTWHFRTPSNPSTPAERSACVDALVAFYNSIDGDLLSSVLSTPMTYKVYDLGLPKPRAPLMEFSSPIVPSTSAQCPEEAALCLSFQGDRISGVSQARRRGRVYIGPLPATVLSAQPEAGRVRPTLAARTALQQAGLNLLTASNTSVLFDWIVYSETNAPLGGPDAGTIVRHGWVDDALDTQRRRGPGPTSRLTFGSLA